MAIPIKPLRQAGPELCSVACLTMILNYYGHGIDQQGVFAALPRSSGEGPLLTDLAQLAQKLGLKVDCLAYNLYLTAPEDAALPMDELARTLQIERRVIKESCYLRMIDSILDCIGAGANYLIAKPSVETITSYLDKSIPLILSVSHTAWYNTQGDPYEAHAVVLSGIDEDRIHFIDPGYSGQDRLAVADLRLLDPGQAREGSINLDDLRFAMLSRKTTDAAAYMLAVKPCELTPGTSWTRRPAKAPRVSSGHAKASGSPTEPSTTPSSTSSSEIPGESKEPEDWNRPLKALRG